MATSLLRLGRLGPLKCLQQEGWGSLRTPLTATFCTKAEAPKKSAKKASTLEAPDERAALLAYKTTVAFPTRLSTPGFLSQGVALGEYEQNGDPVTNAVAAGAASAQPAPSTAQVLAKPSSEESTTAADAKQSESVTTPAAETATEKDATIPTSADVEALKSEVTPKDDEDTSSSSSSSDSDSDSDSDDEKPDKTELAKPVVHTEDKAGQDEKPSAVSEEHASDVKTRAVPEHVEPSVPEGAPKGAVKGAPQEAEVVSEPKFKKVPDPSTASAPSEDIVDPAPVLCTAASVKAQANVIPESETGVEVKSSEVSGAIPKPVTKSAPDVSAEPTPEVVLDSATKVASEPEPEIKTAPKTPKAVAAAEELVDTAPAITAAEEVRADPDVSAAPEEAAAAPAPAPAPEPEPFDNTTYKNLQHHSYNIYTFVDMDVEMAKNRLPQPSTGRPSPRH